MRSLWLAAVLAATPAHAAGERTMVRLSGPRDASGTPEERVVPSPLPADAPYPAAVYRGAADLGLSREFVAHVAQGLELLYERRYRETRTFFAELEAVFPGTAVSAVGDLLVWQALMLENFDFRYDDQYRAASKLARTKLAEAAAQPGREAWEELMLGVVVGIEAIHAARSSKYLPALSQAFEAIDHMESARTLAPSFLDIQLADGLYNYWRSVLTDRIKGLPDFGDRRQEGLDQIRAVARDGVFLGPPARLALAFSWLEEKDYDQAHAELSLNHAAYPGNLINEQMIGLTEVYRRRYTEAVKTFDHVLEIDGSARRVLYYKALALQRAGKDDDALALYRRYLDTTPMEPYQRAGALYRIGQIQEQRKAWDPAEEAYREAIKTDGHDGAKAGLDRVRAARKGG